MPCFSSYYYLWTLLNPSEIDQGKKTQKSLNTHNFNTWLFIINDSGISCWIILDLGGGQGAIQHKVIVAHIAPQFVCTIICSLSEQILIHDSGITCLLSLDLGSQGSVQHKVILLTLPLNCLNNSMLSV